IARCKTCRVTCVTSFSIIYPEFLCCPMGSALFLSLRTAIDTPQTLRQFLRIRNRWLATEVRANNRSGCFFGKCRQVRNGFGQSGRKILRHNVFKPCQFDHSLVQSKRRHGRPVEILCYFIISNHHHLSVWPREVYGSNPISRGEQAVLPGQSGQNLESLFGFVTIAWLVGVSVHPQQSDRRDRIAGGSGRIVKRLAAGEADDGSTPVPTR